MERVPIPGPAPLPLVGNIADVDAQDSLGSLGRLADLYGEIYKLTLGGTEKVVISSVALLNEICDETRFTKAVSGPLEQIRNGVEDGLFTAYPGEHNWEVAHRTLMPAFGPLSIRNMFDEMHDIASQLIVKWARFGDGEKIDVVDDFTRLTLDSIALCAMDSRFNSFYKHDLHPFVGSMVGFLTESGNRARRPAFSNYLFRSATANYENDIALLRQVAKDVIAERRKHPSDKKDLLNALLNGRDPKTGEGLTDASVMNNMITFLIAGHETTSGMLSFLFYYLIKNPETYQKAQKEVDEVVGRGPVTVEHMPKLHYLNACLRETLRLTPTASAFTLQPLPDMKNDSITIGDGKYEIKKGQPILAILPKIHRDPAVYGSDAEEFRPERMLDDAFSKLAPNSWKPFGNGVRGCIGRPFAWQEALLSVSLLLQMFNFRMDDPSYTLVIQQTLTIKPKGFYMHAKLRDNIDPVHIERMMHTDTVKLAGKDKPTAKKAQIDGKKPMTILYGSNSGTCEALAQSLARAAGSRGFNASVDSLDTAVDNVPNDRPVIMICSSYEGQPPDNAAHFVAWLKGLGANKALEGAKYAIFGCGNHDWVSTFHKVPITLDECFSANGASCLAKTGLGDVGAGDIFDDFDKWQDEALFPGLGFTSSSSTEDDPGVDVEIDTTSRRSTLRQDVKEAVVISNDILTKNGYAEKRHIVLQLPTGMTYKVGDYLAVLPINNAPTIRRVLKRFGLPWDAMISIKAGANTTLPTGHPLSIMDVLGAYVELSQPATRKNIQKIASSIASAEEREKVSRLAGPNFDAEVTQKRLSPLNILEAFPSAALLFSAFLSMLPPMRIRQYSISSSPLSSSDTCSISWSVLDTPSLVAEGKGKRFLGVASNYLSNVEEGDHVHVTVKPSHGNFKLPSDVEKTPLIMLCAGTGLAPFRGFLEERACQMAAGRKLAPAYIFIGCKSNTGDRIFASDLEKWESSGVVTVFYAHSQEHEKSQGCKYIQDRLWKERAEMRKVFDEGANIYICGSAKVGEGVAAKVKDIYREAALEQGVEKSDEDIEEWFKKTMSDRYASDVFA